MNQKTEKTRRVPKVDLYLDDVRTPKGEGWVIVRNYEEFINKILEIGIENIYMISLDHDLGDSAIKEYFNNVITNFTLNYSNITEKTGLDCLKWLVNYCLEYDKHLPEIYSHSANPIGAANIIGYANAYFAFKGLPQTSVRVRIPHTVENVQKD